MPIYNYRCTGCSEEQEFVLPIAERDNFRIHSCGFPMQRLISLPQPVIMKLSGREKTLQTLNKEGNYDFPGGEGHRPRYERAMAKDLYPEKPTIGRGFTPKT